MSSVEQISIRGEDYIEVKLAKSNMTSSDWERLYVELPDGTYQIILNGYVEGNGNISGILVDDINIWPCRKFGRILFST